MTESEEGSKPPSDEDDLEARAARRKAEKGAVNEGKSGGQSKKVKKAKGGGIEGTQTLSA